MSKAQAVRRAIGDENFFAYTTYRFYDGACAFSIEPVDGANVHLALSHKPDFSEQGVDGVHFVLQEACSCSIDRMLAIDASGGICRAGGFDLEEFDRCVSRILRILHRGGIVHRDIKPQNIVYCPFSVVKYKLIDYAFAESINDLPQMPSVSLAGTRAFMSPYLIGLLNRMHGKDAQSTEHVDVPLGMRRLLASRRHAKFYDTLLRGHIVSLRRSNQYGSMRYVLMKSDEYAYMLTLLLVYRSTHDANALAKATMLSLCSYNFYGET
jgi:serine/threonine protein kinase